MTVDYAAIAAEVQGAFAEVKQGTVTLTRTVPGDPPDPEQPWIPGDPVTTTYTLDAIVKGVSDKYVDGTTILSTDLEISCSVFAVDPLPSDTLAIDGKTVTVIKSMPYPAAGQVVIHKFIVRG